MSVKYLNPKLTGDDANDYTKNAALNNLKIFIVAIGDDSLIYPITYVTAGSPIKKQKTAIDLLLWTFHKVGQLRLCRP
ncbi:MAG: hypothetical protein CM15mV52_0070 [uncultured marine virus]|nr:MAG: hypothetical protein CM15mV52_0070 [uncultured marine virus]